MDQLKTNSNKETPRSGPIPPESLSGKDQGQKTDFNQLPERKPLRIDTIIDMDKTPQSETLQEIPTSVLINSGVKPIIKPPEELDEMD